MKNIILIFAFVCISLSSCQEKFLEEEVFTFLSPSNFYKTAEDARLARNSCYSSFQDRPMYEVAMVRFADFASDVADRNGQLDPYHTFSVTAEDDMLINFWLGSYQGINRTHAVLERIPAIGMDEEEKKVILAEARFVRALHYFNLIRLWGNVPYVITESLGTDNISPTNVGTSDDVWALIIEDLTIGETDLLSSYDVNETGRATGGAASALLAKVYLTRSGYGVADEWAMAAQKASEVMGMSYKLLDNYADVFDIRLKNNAESIFDIQNSISDGFVNGMARLEKDFGVNALPRSNPYQGNSFATGTKSFYASWTDPNDKRFYATWLDSLDNNGSELSYPDNGMLTPHTRKWKIAAEDIPRLDRFGQNFTIIRYADVLLMHSEAENMANGPSASAVNGINQVRTRAGLTPIDAGSVSKEQLRQLIITERAKELCFEFHTFFDYQRQNVLAVKMGTIGISVPEHRNFYPIPQLELSTNPNLRQNNGY